MEIKDTSNDFIVPFRKNEIDEPNGATSLEVLRKMTGIYGYQKFRCVPGDGFEGVHFTGTWGQGLVFNVSNSGRGGFIMHVNSDGRLYVRGLGGTYDLGWSQLNIENILKLNTPYHATKMQQLGIYEDFIAYMDSQHEYEQLQREVESKRQEAYPLALIDNSELSYETWLSEQAEMLPIVGPVPSQALLDFKKKYLG